jgi:hypothetical protein
MIPCAAVGFKKYLEWTGPVSMTPNNEDALPGLRNSEVLAVKYTPSDRIPELGQRSGNDGKVSSSM